MMGRLRLRAGQVEIELEVEGDSFEKPLREALSAIAEMTHSPLSAALLEPGDDPPETARNSRSDASINTVVAKLGGGSARAILKAAAAHLTLVDGQDVFTRDAWLARAHEARDWQAGYRPNQGRDIKRLVETGDVFEKAGNKYSLPSRAIEEARRLLTHE